MDSETPKPVSQDSDASETSPETKKQSPVKRGRSVSEPSPHDVTDQISKDRDTSPRTKLSRTGLSAAEEVAMAADSTFESQPPVSHVARKASSSSLNSDLSSNSSHRDQQVLSPVPRSFASDIPPAPPSTPASSQSLASFDGAATPLPIQAGVQNADMLEAQLLSDSIATPAPTKVKKPLPEDFSDWAVGDRYELVRILGRGSYGEVAQAIDLKVGKRDAFVAIKRIQSPFDQEVDAVRLYREIHILRRMRGHECIIQLMDIVQPPTDDLDDFHDLYLVFEYVDTDLYKLIMSPQYLTTEHIQTFLYQMLVGIKFIHSFSVIHRDLKPANILLNEDCSLKICDFGLARMVDTESMSSTPKEKDSDEASKSTSSSLSSPPRIGLTRQLTKHVVTRWYRAPELILIQPYTSAVDIWSVGCILAELLSMQEGNVAGYQDRKPLFPGGTCFPLSGEGDKMSKDDRLDQLSVILGVIGTPTEEDLAVGGKSVDYIKSLGKIDAKPFEKIFPAADTMALDLLRKMLQFNPSQRCTADQALDHDFFKSVRRKEMERDAPDALEGPGFLNADKIDLRVLKREVFKEVRWFRDAASSLRP